MSIKVKRGAAYASIASIKVKRNCAYAAVQGVFVKTAGVYRSALGAAGPLPYLGQVANRTRIPQFKGTTSKQLRGQTVHANVEACTQMILGFPNWYVAAGSTFTELGSGGPCTWACGIEYPEGVFTRVFFAGGATSGVAPDGGEVFGTVDVSIPANTNYKVHWDQRHTTGAVLHWGTGEASPNCAFSTAYGDRSDIAASGLTDKTMSGTYANSAAGVGCGPHIIAAMITKPSVLNIGTSIDRGTGGAQDAVGAEGQFERSLIGNFGHCNVGIGSDFVEKFILSGSKRAAMASYFSHVLFGGATNDVINTSKTAAQINADMQTMYAMFPGKKLFQATVMPCTTSSGGQTPSARSATRIALNALIRGAQPLLTGVFELAEVVETSRDSGVWKLTSYTPDGIHPSQLGYIAIKDSGAVDISRIVR